MGQIDGWLGTKYNPPSSGGNKKLERNQAQVLRPINRRTHRLNRGSRIYRTAFKAANHGNLETFRYSVVRLRQR